MIDIVHSKSGSSVSIHPFGATIISYKSSGGENLFVSRLSKLDGSKAIRGGIPIVFPIFGPPPKDSGSTMPQHGFARNNMWKVKEGSQHDSDSHAGVTLTLDLADASKGRGGNNIWSESEAKTGATSCQLIFEVKVDNEALSTTMIVQNTGSDAFDFNCLLHTYYAVEGKAAQDPKQCYAKGLQGYSIIDKVRGVSGEICGEDPVDLTAGAVDSVYMAPEGKMAVNVEVGVGGGRTVKMEAFGTIDDKPVPASCVVWNPSAEGAAGMGDFGDDQYQEMICVEPGILGDQPALGPGKKASLTQLIFA
jgi:glucose-6-phosphate 1-epimerase